MPATDVHSWSDTHRRFVRNEVIVNSIISAVLSAGFVWLIFGGRPRAPLWGMDGVAFDFVPMTFAISFMMTLGLTLYTRKRAATGKAPILSSRPRLPRILPARMVANGLLMTLLLVPLIVALLWLAGRRDYAYAEIMAMKMLYGAIVAAVVTPLIITEALRDGFRRAAR